MASTKNPLEGGVQSPRPVVTGENAFFWEGARSGQLLIQKCASCEELRHPPRPGCPWCRSLAWDTHEVSGRGLVYSYVIHHEPPIPGFSQPITVVLVELEEGPRLVSNLVEVEASQLAIGAEVEVVFTALADGFVLPQFRPRSTKRK